jgi:hypothetical protein
MQWIHLVLSALIGLLVWMATTRLLSDDRFRISFFIAFMCGVYQLMISVFLWSELLFLVLLLLFSESLIRCRLSLWALSGVFIFGTLMCLQRNAGLFLVPAAALWIWLVIADRRKSVLAAVFTLTSTWAGVWWNVSNMFVSKTEVSELQYGEFIWPNFLMMTDGLTRSLVPITVLSIPFAMLMVAIPAVLLWRNRQKSPEPFLGILYVGAYVGGISTLFEMDPSDADRYTAVILPSLMLPIFVVSEKFFKSGAKIVRQVVLAVMFVWLLYPLARTLKNAFQWHESSCQMATSNKASK